MSVTRADVAAAAERIDEVVVRTPLQYCERWSTALGATVLLKREDQQPVRSYKIRGALNIISQLTPEQRWAGVVAASAGNHAQGVALACADLQVKARIYLPTNTPRQKRDRVAAFGKGYVELVVGGESYDDAAAAAKADAARTGATLVPAFDDPRVVAGQGTVMAEVIDELKDVPDVVLVPVGGGGLLAGTIAALGDSRVRVVAVEPTGAASLKAALDAGTPVTLDELDRFADGTAVRRVGDVPFPIIKDAAPEIVLVDEGAICVEMLELYQSEGIIAEPSGALAPAALGQIEVERGDTVVVIISGGNNDVSRYADVVERALVHEGRKHYFMVEFSQEPGALRRFLHDVLGPDDDIALFEYVKRNNREFGPALVGIELGSADDYEPLLKRMEASPLRIEHLPPDSPLFGFAL
ncbi:threonine ammonia-lyase IlvA [Yimella sp. cx-51]|uniref:threonine ammonia-lyase IlvA n=1 Tax=Yimella sp. cx-51 TaxID=2770551 RepID=UPI00165D7A01|nr:threonine ammonia-lyase IlvA [Yimella sp. cx-51]MBC9958028.1 threonine ammonia-lyase IlvA [Yimella sp. cx-51]QTH38148.1 threonine ammonia-lyase IlvA [Yimella sp. cx-51]